MMARALDNSEIIGIRAPARLAHVRQRRTTIAYVAACATGLLPTLLDMSPALRAAGLGLIFPGAGFLTQGPFGLLLALVSIAVFAAGFVAWFGAACWSHRSPPGSSA
jgi:hypothetical protein